MAFLPICKKELKGQPDFIMVTVDAYVDHPSFGHAIISRIVESRGFSIAIIPQPVSDADYTALGAPKLGFLVSGGVVDSMVANYTVAKQRRDKDSYSEGGEVGKVPDRALTVHSRNLKRLFPDIAVAIGGIEASLRRFAHYDYWSDSVMPSLLVDSQADLLMYGMGEVPINEILTLIAKGARLSGIKDVRGTAYLSDYDHLSKRVKRQIEERAVIELPSYERVCSDKLAYVEAFNLQYKNSEYTTDKLLIQPHGDKLLVVNPPQRPISTEELDEVYALPFERQYHPTYKRGVPALTEVKFSLCSHRGCFGACNYCAIAMHQGRIISKRSKQSLLDEAETLTKLKDFKGYIHDVGGPTANFRNPSCEKQATHGSCTARSCIGYQPCANLRVDHSEYMDILRALRALPNIKKVFIRSGIRYDYLMMDDNRKSVISELCEHHISGQLKVAPEHCSENVLKLMNKPSFEVYKAFGEEYKQANAQRGKEQYLVPYLISSHPGCTLSDAIDLARYLKSIHYTPLQVQDFYPTPSTKSTTMYYTGIDPDTMREVYVPRSKEEKRTQRALMQWSLPKNYATIKQALIDAKRLDLLGDKPHCLIPSHVKPDSRKKK